MLATHGAGGGVALPHARDDELTVGDSNSLKIWVVNDCGDATLGGKHTRKYLEISLIGV